MRDYFPPVEIRWVLGFFSLSFLGCEQVFKQFNSSLAAYCEPPRVVLGSAACRCSPGQPEVSWGGRGLMGGAGGSTGRIGRSVRGPVLELADPCKVVGGGGQGLKQYRPRMHLVTGFSQT